MAKWKCEICGNEFDNFHAQGFDNRIYCPLCYFKKENQELKSQLKGTTHCFDEEEHRKLQENYDRIYAENCKLREEHNINDISLLDENYRLKKGIDEAIEYVEWNKDKAKFDNNTKEYDNYTFLNEENINDLLDILNEVLE